MEDTFALGDKNAPIVKASYYAKEMKPFPTEAYLAQEKARDATSDRRSNWGVGHFGEKWVSECKKKYFSSK